MSQIDRLITKINEQGAQIGDLRSQIERLKQLITELDAALQRTKKSAE